jgi:hypothetical protein
MSTADTLLNISCLASTLRRYIAVLYKPSEKGQLVKKTLRGDLVKDFEEKQDLYGPSIRAYFYTMQFLIFCTFSPPGKTADEEAKNLRTPATRDYPFRMEASSASHERFLHHCKRYLPASFSYLPCVCKTSC